MDTVYVVHGSFEIYTLYVRVQEAEKHVAAKKGCWTSLYVGPEVRVLAGKSLFGMYVANVCVTIRR